MMKHKIQSKTIVLVTKQDLQKIVSINDININYQPNKLHPWVLAETSSSK